MSLRKKRINDVVIVVDDGKIYTRTGVDDVIWLQILEQCNVVDELAEEEDWAAYDYEYQKLVELLDPKLVAQRLAEEAAKKQALEDAQLEIDFTARMRKAKRIADISGLFEYDEDGVTYLKGFKHPMPKILVEALLDAHYNPSSNYTVSSLINFWKYLLLNPDKHVRSELFAWIKTGNFAITEEGNIIAYRNVDVKQKSTNKSLQDFISESWTKVKKNKKSPKNYWVYKLSDDTYTLANTDSNGLGYLVGNLFDLNEQTVGLDDMGASDVTIYTDNYTHSMTIKLGEIVSMPRTECDNDSDSSCSKGLHAKSAAHCGTYGTNTLVTLINPYHVVAIPTYDRSKFRCCQYLPVSKAEVANGHIVEFNPGTYEIPYNGLGTLVDLLKTTSIEELQKGGELSDELNFDDFQFVMNKAIEVINKRVIVVE